MKRTGGSFHNHRYLVPSIWERPIYVKSRSRANLHQVYNPIQLKEEGLKENVVSGSFQVISTVMSYLGLWNITHSAKIRKGRKFTNTSGPWWLMGSYKTSFAYWNRPNSYPSHLQIFRQSIDIRPGTVFIHFQQLCIHTFVCIFACFFVLLFPFSVRTFCRHFWAVGTIFERFQGARNCIRRLICVHRGWIRYNAFRCERSWV